MARPSTKKYKSKAFRLTKCLCDNIIKYRSMRQHESGIQCIMEYVAAMSMAMALILRIKFMCAQGIGEGELGMRIIKR